jgi:Fe-S-cluster-containing hydrogenase component 2
MKATRKIIQIDEERCNGCGRCVSACAEGAIALVNGKARLVAENYCDGLAACLGDCPEGALTIVEREADAFDPEAVEEHLEEMKKKPSLPLFEAPTLACGCPSTQVRMFGSPGETCGSVETGQKISSALTHWPVQIRLVPPTAPFLKGADLLIASDCTAVAYPGFHQDLLPGKVVLMGCPKFDDGEDYIQRLAEIFRQAGITSVTVAIMEVPCCSKMPVIVGQALALSGKRIPVEVVVISALGEILRREGLAA